VEGSPYAIGYFGYAYYQENQGSLKALSINGIEPNAETAESGEYPIARPLFLYSDAAIMQEKPQVAAFIWFYLNNLNNEILDVGYFPVSEARLQENLNAWNEAMGMSAGSETSSGTASEELAMYAPDAVTGDIITAGSSTVFPLSERMKQRFEEEGFAGNLTIDSIGSGAGIERFCVAGETDVANASRAMKDSEKESCAALSPARTPVEFQVGIDALAVVVSSENDFAQDITLEELAAIFSTATNWSDVRSEWPNEPIQRFSPGTDSGTFDYFVEAVMAPANGDDADAGSAAIQNSAGTQFSEDDNVLVQGVEGSPYAIGYFGYAYFQENQGGLKALSINGVEPNAETAESGEYPLSRPLFIYSDAAIMQEKPQVAAFIWFYLNNVNKEILDVGYFPVSEGKTQENIDAWNSALGL
jgi:phosphate binding protein